MSIRGFSGLALGGWIADSFELGFVAGLIRNSNLEFNQLIKASFERHRSTKVRRLGPPGQGSFTLITGGRLAYGLRQMTYILEGNDLLSRPLP